MNKIRSFINRFINRTNNLSREILKAELAEGYLIMITRKEGDGLKHIYFTRTFPREDISLAIEEHKKLLEREITFKSTESKETEKVEGQKKLPPEYREKP